MNQSKKGNWVFIKLYKYNTNNPIYMVLNGFIKKVNPVKGFFYNHSAINTRLNDDYLAVKVPKLTRESSKSMKYAKRGETQCDIYGINCSPSEYAKVIALLDYAEKNKSKIYYDMLSIVTSFIKSQNDRKDNGVYKDDGESHQNDIVPLPSDDSTMKKVVGFSADNTNIIANKYVCSSFIAYVLSNSIPDIKLYLKKMGFDSLTISPSEIAKFPRLQLLYRCDIGDIDSATQDFIHKNPSFKKYYDYSIPDNDTLVKKFSNLNTRLDGVFL